MCVAIRLRTGINIIFCMTVILLMRSKKRFLCRGLVFYMGREVPREQLLLVIRSFGGQVGWEGEESPFKEDDPSITHQVPPAPHVVFSSEINQAASRMEEPIPSVQLYRPGLPLVSALMEFSLRP